MQSLRRVDLMKLVVKECFIDKYTQAVYKAGEEINIGDAERAADLESRGLAAIVEEKRVEPVKKAPRRTSKAKQQ